MTASTESPRPRSRPLPGASGEGETSGASGRGGRGPDFLVVGHPKSGTTALWDMLKRHPQIYMPANKEPYFFADELRPPAATPRTFGHTPATLEEYLSLFDAAQPQQRVGEASAPYLWSRTAAANIAAVRPDARIVAILREPASFIRSLHLQLVQIYIEPERDLRRALALEGARREGRHLPRNRFWGPGGTLYSDYVRYVEQLRRFHEAFGRERVLVLIYDDFRADNDATVRRVLRFLDVDDTLPLATSEANPTVRVRSRRLFSLVHTLASGEGALPRAVRRAAATVAPAALDRRAALAIRNRIFFARPHAADPDVTADLRRRFKGEVEAVSEYLGRDLVRLWGYDRIA